MIYPDMRVFPQIGALPNVTVLLRCQSSAVSSCCVRSHFRNPRHTTIKDDKDIVILHYPWHPLAGKPLKLESRRMRNNVPFLRCVVTEGNGEYWCDYPEWMFDPACGSMRLECSPCVCAEAKTSPFALTTYMESLSAVLVGPPAFCR